MTDVIVERDLTPPLTAEQFPAMAKQGANCLKLYNIDWVESYLSADGASLVCHFIAPDTETTRTAVRQTGSDLKAAWPGTLHHGAAADETPNVMVTRSFEEPIDLDDIQAIEDAGTGWRI